MQPGINLDRPETIRQLLLVSPELLPRVWPQVEPLFLEHPEQWEELFTIESIAFLLQKGNMQLWTMNDEDGFLLAMVTELLAFPKARVLNILLLVGSELGDGLMFLDCVEMWANKQGAVKSTVVGRQGLLRVLKPYGYNKKALALEKDISSMMEH